MAMPASRSLSLAAATYSRRVFTWWAGRAGPFLSVLPSRYRRCVFQLLGLEEHGDVVEELHEVAVEHALELVRGEVDPVIGDAALRKVVRPDFFGSFTGAHLAPAVLRDRFLLLPHLHLVEARAQHLHRLRAILDL